MRNAYKISVGKLKRREQHGGPMRRCEVDIKRNLKELGVKLWTGFK
jgi:hypothetical protein